ncbi:MAG: lactate dehydrogenase [Methanomicrobiaceae archaeon]|nr:lactate dehydrogenase [Methanomicrobiaceae archaeon]
MTSLSVMGVGRVGGEVAYLAAVLGLVDTINLHDTYKPLLEAQILDLEHTGLDIRVSRDPADIHDTDVFVFAAGTPRTPDVKTRADLLQANLPVADLCSKYLRRFDGMLITITNPMDANNYYLWKKTGLDRGRCIGSGGMLDSARFSGFLRQRGIDGEGWVLGEHGEHQVPVFSRLARSVPEQIREEILGAMGSASMQVIRGKGGTVFGPAYHTVTLIRAILEDAGEVYPCSCVLDGEYGVEGCSLGVPARIGGQGVEEILEWDLDAWEQRRFREAAAFEKQLVGQSNE